MQNTVLKKKIKTAFIGIGVATFMALLSYIIYTTTDLADNYYYNLSEALSRSPQRLTNELTAAYSYLLLLPLVIRFFKKLPLNSERLFTKIIYYLLFSVFIGLSMTTMMYLSRFIIYPILGLKQFDPGYLPIRILMEYLKQLGLFGVTYVIYTLYRTSKERELQRLKTIRLEEELTKARLETLKMQLNPHFLFNTLNMISSTMYQDLNAADKMLATLSDLLRITLKSSGEGKNTLKEELYILDLYLQIMKERFKDKLDIDLKIDDNTLNALVPVFFFQPLVENSIKYGMENLTSTQIDISSNKLNGNLVLKIKDNGPGISEENKRVIGSGIGLTNTVERLEKLYGKNHEFSWENKESGGLVLTIEIPYTEKDNGNEDISS